MFSPRWPLQFPQLALAVAAADQAMTVPTTLTLLPFAMGHAGGSLPNVDRDAASGLLVTPRLGATVRRSEAGYFLPQLLCCF